jgi:hypothetical protein
VFKEGLLLRYSRQVSFLKKFVTPVLLVDLKQEVGEHLPGQQRLYAFRNPRSGKK